ncbi:kell blood group glycoprotein isoform X1 [Takifugu rubripes]|uniref:kell blood group glycoprotein isoform X1 n=1 Tax=Takifugu rubripes TaxID=31033 RepID=UPI001145A66E|nr:kell blood group glycoprotein isoform X1 [Takifugu rubripes]
MSEGKLELSVQPLSQPGPEQNLQPPPLSQQPVPTPDPPEADRRGRTQLEQQRPKPDFLKHRRLLVLLLGFLSSAAFGGLLYYILNSLPANHYQAHEECLSPACQWASARLSVSADPFSRPCDYFLHTCTSDRLSSSTGSSRRRQDIYGHPQSLGGDDGGGLQGSAPGSSEEDVLDRKAALLLYLREILESQESWGSTAVRKARRFYQTCLDTKSIDSAGAEPFLALVQKLGGWPVSGQWIGTDFNSTLRILMKDYATFPFFSLQVGRDPKEITSGKPKKYIQIDQPNLLIPIEWNSTTQKSQAITQTLLPFLASCQMYLALLGSPPNSSTIHLYTFVSLSSELAVAAAPRHYRLSKGLLYQRMTIKELQRHAPAIDWLGGLQAAFPSLPLTEDDLVLLHNLPYLVQMSRIIGKWLNKHEPRTSSPLHTYMVFHLLHTVMPAMDSRFTETAKKLSVALGTREGVAPRWKHCVLQTERGFNSVFGNILSERFHKVHREQVEEIIQNILSSFKSKLHELEWTDPKSLQFVMKRVDSLIPRLWITLDSSSEAELDLLLSESSTQTFFSNYVRLLSFWQKRRNKLLFEQAEVINPVSVTPLLLGNELFFPPGMFVPPLFHSTYPRAMHYGIMGFLIAKDILHLILPDIYSYSATVHAVGECVWTHYLAVTEKEEHDGALSLSPVQLQEVWLQYSALQIALQAYNQSLKSNPSDTSVSGLPFIPLFLRAFSQVNCDSDRYRDFMPLEPSFLTTVLCSTSNRCPTNLHCPNKSQQHSFRTC